jgi:hypothetical protein
MDYRLVNQPTETEEEMTMVQNGTTVLTPMGVIVTWDLRGMGYPQSPELRSLLRNPTVYRHQLRWQKHLRDCGILNDADFLFYRAFDGMVVLTALRCEFRDSLTPDFVAERLGVIEYPSMAVIEAVSDEVRAALENLPLHFDALALTPAIVKHIEWHGGVAVRAAGGAYYLPPDAYESLRPIFDAIQREGGRVRFIDVDPHSDIAREIACDAVRILTALMAQLKKAFESAKNEARKERSLKRLKEVRKHLDHYLALMQQMREEIENEDTQQVTADLLMEVAV